MVQYTIRFYRKGGLTVKKRSRLLSLLLALVLLALVYNYALAPAESGQPAAPQLVQSVAELDPAEAPASPQEATQSEALDEDGSYTTAEDVCAYLQQYGHLPANFITKKQAQALGWEGGSLEKIAPGKCIGGDYFGNYEGLLPKAPGRKWTECDINTLGKRSRGPERLIFSNDGLIYYTGDHYESFQLLAGEP